MSEYPYMQVYVNDWMSDPLLSMCSPATRGIWMDALCAMHITGERSITGSVSELATSCRCSPFEMRDAVDDLVNCGVATVSYAAGTITLAASRIFWPRDGRPAIPAAVRRRVLSVGACLRCGSRENLSVDHIIPYSRGGAHKERNFQCLCLPCNMRKGAKVP